MIERALNALGASGWVIVGDPIYQNIQWQNNIVLFTEQEVNAKIAELAAIKKPDPKGFYEKLIGVRGTDYPLHQVYQSITFQALDQTKDTSSLSYAVTVFNNALNINDWSRYGKDAYAQAYNILKPFLSAGQITIVDTENKNFGLV